MSKVKAYNFEKYSILDIEEYLKWKWYEIETIPEEENRARKLHIIDTDIYFDYPQILSGTPMDSCIRFESYPITENFEKSKKLFEVLKRKFWVKDSEVLVKIKDKDKIFIRNWDKIRKERKEQEEWWDKKWYKFW